MNCKGKNFYFRTILKTTVLSRNFLRFSSKNDQKITEKIWMVNDEWNLQYLTF